jgi:cytolysin-activating lysine-acyltransferase
MTQEQIKQLAEIATTEAKKVFHKIPILGPVTWLMMHQSTTKFSLLCDMEWRIMPPLMLDQAKLYMKDESPLAFVSWAKLSDEVVARYKTPPHHLTPSDWKTGEQIWIVDMLVPFGGAQDVLKDLKENVFKGETLYQLAPMPSGEVQVLTW